MTQTYQTSDWLNPNANGCGAKAGMRQEMASREMGPTIVTLADPG